MQLLSNSRVFNNLKLLLSLAIIAAIDHNRTLFGFTFTSTNLSRVDLFIFATICEHSCFHSTIKMKKRRDNTF